MKRNNSFLLREIANVPYLLPYGQMIADHKWGIKLNATGVYLWKLLEQERTLNELLSLSAAYYEIPEQELPSFQADIKLFLNQLLSMGILEEDAPPATASGYTKQLLSIGGLGIALEGPAEAFPEEFTDFVVTECACIHQRISLHIGLPPIPQNGQVILRNRELVILQQEEYYILLFPEVPQISEIHLKKDASLALCYCQPPYTDTFKYDLFHALRLLFLYLAQKHHMVAIHSASILYQNKVWIFSGHSGMGKSTHTNLWKRLYDTPVVNGDLNLLAIENGQAVVHGIPWCGTSGIYDTKTYPLGGIILLKKAPTDHIELLSPDQKQLLICQRLISPTWTEELFDMNMDFVESITEKIMVCRLHCTKENSAVEIMKRQIDINLC